MGFVGNLVSMNAYGKKQCRSLFWRMRAAVKKALKNGGKQKQLKFHYDPSSYALNFDDGCRHLGDKKVNDDGAFQFQPEKFEEDWAPTAFVYVIWVKTSN